MRSIYQHIKIFVKISDPHWASINIGIVLCKKCAGKIIKIVHVISDMISDMKIKNKLKS